MTDRFDDILRDLPAGLTEADLIDMVDGGVSPEREGVVIDALRARPRLGLLIKQMRADRTAVQATGHALDSAPANMLDAIDAKLDRAALSELVHEAEEATAPIPISRVVPVRRGVITVLAEGVWARRLATAASIAIVGGLGVLGARELMSRWPRVPGPSPLANNDTTEHAPELVGPPHETHLAAKEPAPSSDGAAPVAVAKAGDEPVAKSAAEPSESAPTLTAAAAVKLAREGRLVITVRSKQWPGSLRHLENLSRAAGPDMRWRSHEMSKLPVELASLATPLPDARLENGTGIDIAFPGGVAKPPVLASDHADVPAPAMEDRTPGPREAALHRVVKGVLVVRMSADEQRLGDLLRDLNITKDQVAEFHELPAAAALDHRPALDADSVLWWAAGSEAWTTKIAVPIVVEGLE